MVIKGVLSLVAILLILQLFPLQNVYGMQDESSVNVPDDFVSLPAIKNISKENDIDFSNPETVAGDEEIIPVESSNNVTQTLNFSVQPVSQNNPIIPAANQNNLAVAQSNTESDGEVLSVQTSESTDLNKPLEVEESKVTDIPENTSVNNPAVYWWYPAGGAVAFIGLVVLILFLRRQ